MNNFCITTLTHNAPNRAHYLKKTISTFIEATNFDEKFDWYIFVNGINNELLETFEWAKSTYSEKVNWNIEISEINLGVGVGINKLNTKTLSYKYVFFLEGDWIAIPPYVSGHSKDWFSNSIKLLEETPHLDQIQFRRYLDDIDDRQYTYSAFIMKEKIKDIVNNGDIFFILKNRPYYNPPSLRRNASLFEKGVFPLAEYFDENGVPLEIKGNIEWGQAEIQAENVQNIETAWLKFGNFVHCDDWVFEDNWELYKSRKYGCGKYPIGYTTCKYGYMFPNHYFCGICDTNQTIHDLVYHNNKFENEIIPLLGDGAPKDVLVKKIHEITKNPTIEPVSYINHEVYKNKRTDRGNKN